jgi:hypothetical protein
MASALVLDREVHPKTHFTFRFLQYFHPVYFQMKVRRNSLNSQFALPFKDFPGINDLFQFLLACSDFLL